MKLHDHRSFILCLVSVIGALGLAYYRPGTEATVLTTLPILLGTYIGARSAEKILSVKAASADANCDTAEVIKNVIK